MNKSAIDHIHRSQILETGKKIKAQIENVVNSINLKYPELAGNIELPDIFGDSESKDGGYYRLRSLSSIMWKNNLMA